MKVTILNPIEAKSLLSDWGTFASVCYDSKSNPQKVGEHCLESEHFSGSRWRYIAFRIEDVPRFLIDQLVRHEQGVVKNVQSFRYVDKENFSYDIPNEILDNKELVEKYSKYMDECKSLYSDIKTYIINKGFSKEKANEKARYIIPMSTLSSVDIAFTPEALIHLCHKRLCNRAESPIRELTNLIKRCVLQILPELKDYLVPQCEYLLWCPEKNGCGKMPNKEKLVEKLLERFQLK